MKNSSKVKQIYEMSGLTYEQLSGLTRISENTLACWITGRRNPPDYVVSYLLQKVENFLDGGGEYINVQASRDDFVEAVYNAVSDEKEIQEVIRIFDNLPTISLNERKCICSGEEVHEKESE